MTTSREAYAVTQENPGSDLAAETAAAMAAASIAFRKMDPVYSNELLRHAREVGGDPPNFCNTFFRPTYALTFGCSLILQPNNTNFLSILKAWAFLHSST